MKRPPKGFYGVSQLWPTETGPGERRVWWSPTAGRALRFVPIPERGARFSSYSAALKAIQAAYRSVGLDYPSDRVEPTRLP